jgi:glycerophosphoryl diester phosphodiesterase
MPFRSGRRCLPSVAGGAELANRFRDAFRANLDRPLVLAHRGDSSLAPENTLEAAALGFAAGADGWEFDVQLTRDGVPIVFHDPGLLRTTNVADVFADDARSDLGYLVAEFDLDEIRRLDAGSWFINPAILPRSARYFGTIDQLDPVTLARYGSGSVLVPTLEDALVLTMDLGWLANVEIKSDFTGSSPIASAVRAVIERLGAADHVLVSSFDHEMLAAFGDDSGLTTGVLISTPLQRPASYVESLHADAYHISASALGAGGAKYLRNPSPVTLRRRDVMECRREAIPTLVYTINDLALARHLADLGVAGLFSDNPGPLVAGLTPS